MEHPSHSPRDPEPVRAMVRKMQDCCNGVGMPLPSSAGCARRNVFKKLADERMGLIAGIRLEGRWLGRRLCRRRFMPCLARQIDRLAQLRLGVALALIEHLLQL